MSSRNANKEMKTISARNKRLQRKKEREGGEDCETYGCVSQREKLFKILQCFVGNYEERVIRIGRGLGVGGGSINVKLGYD